MNKYAHFPGLIEVYIPFPRFELRSAESQGESSNHYATAESGSCAKIISGQYWTDVEFQL
jgi:hypothetical protein